MRGLYLLVFAFAQQSQEINGFAKFVNPFIGTGGHGHTFPGATVPFGMVQLSPDTLVDGSWDGCGGYHYGAGVVIGAAKFQWHWWLGSSFVLGLFYFAYKKYLRKQEKGDETL